MLAHFRNKNDSLKLISGVNTSPYSCINARVQAISQFTNIDDLKLPFLISGRLLTAGTYREKGYGPVILLPNVLQESLQGWIGISIYSSHEVYKKIMLGENVSINEVLGKTTRTEWNAKDNGIDFFAEIYDKQIAYKISYGIIKYISVGFGRDIVSEKGDFYYRNLQPVEASIVFIPRDKQAEFKPVN